MYFLPIIKRIPRTQNRNPFISVFNYTQFTEYCL